MPWKLVWYIACKGKLKVFSNPYLWTELWKTKQEIFIRNSYKAFNGKMVLMLLHITLKDAWLFSSSHSPSRGSIAWAHHLLG